LALKARGYKVLAIEQTEGSIMLDEYVDKQMPTAFVFGNEVDGVSDEVIQVCDGVIEIPQWGMKHSLNISVAAAVVLWEFVRKVD
jgi:tRNA G18 (ribose-2'-O)-methylase SpoU